MEGRTNEVGDGGGSSDPGMQGELDDSDERQDKLPRVEDRAVGATDPFAARQCGCTLTL